MHASAIAQDFGHLRTGLRTLTADGHRAWCTYGDPRTDRARGRARCPVVEDVLVDPAQARARVDAVLIPQRPGDPPERIQRVGAPARPVQGDHQELPGPLVGGPLAGLCQQVRHQGAVPTQREQRLNG